MPDERDQVVALEAVLARVNLESPDALATFLHHEIGTVEGVRQTDTFVSLGNRKCAHGPGIL